ncbi:right-handed parallel beta-helix repeat-containing protein [bacterium]|nr:right-handed parallel beta-helix repeat-containing protein [bacterium]
MNGNNTTVLGIEVTNTGAYHTSGIQVGGGDDVKIVNCIIHDLANHSNGIGGWSVGSGHVFYGNNIWGMAPDAGDPHGHGIYSQNEEKYGLKIIRHNIIHNNGKMSMQIGASAKNTYGYRITENTVFKNARYLLCGSSGSHDKRTYNNIIRGNLLYSPAEGGYGDKISLGYTGGICDDNEVYDNYIIGGNATRFLTTGLRNIITHNTFCDRAWPYATLWGSVQHDPPDLSNIMDYNVHYQDTAGRVLIRFRHADDSLVDYTLDDWRVFSGLDGNSIDAGVHEPTENKIVVQPNEYEIKRASIAIYNWEGLDTVNVNVSDVLSTGDYFRLINVEDYFGEAVLEGTYDGADLPIPMAGAEFLCFILSASSFTPPDGEGTYEFYTIATDNAGNVELPPDSPDATTVYDPTAPVSGCSCQDAVNTSSISIPFSAYDATSHVATTKLYYRTGGSGWTFSGLTKSGTSGSFSFPFNSGQGTYYFYSAAEDNAGNTESPKAGPDASTIYDTTRPSSSGSCGEYSKSLPMHVQFTAQDDGSGIASVRLYYSFNGGGFVYSGLEESGTAGNFEFSAPDGEGEYAFYTIAIDAASNSEDAPPSADCAVVYDATCPISSCDSPEYSTGGAIQLAFSASDSGSGVAFCDLHVKHNDGDWQSTGLREYASSGSFSYQPASGDGTYSFFVLATDNAGNREPEKSAESSTLRDTQEPTSSCQSADLTSAASVDVPFSSDDTGSGVSQVKLYFRLGESDWEYSGLAISAESGAFSFHFPQGDGLYGLQTLATDAAGNEETPSANPDTTVLFDTAAPSSICTAPATATDGFDIDYSADDGEGSGITQVELWFRHSYNSGATWDPDWSYAEMTKSPATGSFSYSPALGEGIYEFYTIATDAADNTEQPPATADCATDYITEKPTSWASAPDTSNSNPISISFIARDSSGIDEVQLWYRYSPEVVPYDWSEFSDSSLRSGETEGTINFGAEDYDGQGAYQFYTIGVDRSGNVEDPPSDADCETLYDTERPITVLVSAEYASDASITSIFVADDNLSGIGLVELFSRYSDDNGESFDNWAFTGLYSETATNIFQYSAVDGDGLYEFMALSTDVAGNVEDKGDSADWQVLLDTVAPVATASSLAYATELPLRIDFEASDGAIGSGVASVAFYYRYNQGEWLFTGLNSDGTAGTVFFNPEEGNGTYELIATASDFAGNYEAQSQPVEASIVLDDQSPYSAASCDESSNISAIRISYQSHSGESGIESVALWFRFSSDAGATWEPDWTDTGLESEAQVGTFNFTAEHGEGKYELYTIAINSAGMEELPPLQADTHCIYDTTCPIYQLSSPELSNNDSIQVEYSTDDSDAGSGILAIQLYYSFEGSSWQDSGLSLSQSTGTFDFTPPQGDGVYDFAAIATDRAGNSTGQPTESRTSTRFDTASPSSTLFAPDAVGASDMEIGYTTSDSADLLHVALYLRFSDDCGATWHTDWMDTGLLESEQDGIFQLALPYGEGLYEFRSKATDLGGNQEDKETADAVTVLDQTSPSSEIFTSECASQGTVEISFEATDEGCSSGGLAVRLHFRREFQEWEEADVWGEGTYGTISFEPPYGEGLYQFYCQADDSAGNSEAPTYESQIESLFDSTHPESTCSAPPYKAAPPIEIAIWATDATTRPVVTQLYYRFSPEGAEWNPDWTLAGQYEGSFSRSVLFEPTHGQGIYQFCTISIDECGNSEQLGDTPIVECAFDLAPPISTLTSPAMTNSTPIELEFASSDLLSGVASLEIFYSLAGSEWLPTGLSSEATAGTLLFDEAEEQGIYTFFCAATDMAGNVESPATGMSDYHQTVASSNTIQVHVDYDPPVSNASTPNFANSLPLEITCQSTDGTVGIGTAHVELYYRLEGGLWQSAGISQEYGTGATFTFSPVQGDGLYGFFTIATDFVGNIEAMKDEADTQILLDRNSPNSLASCAPFFTKSELAVSYVADSGMCDIDRVAVWFRHSDGLEWTEWADSGVAGDATSATLNLEAENGDGIYEFYTKASDLCGNVELSPSVADCSTSLDTTPPLCQISVPDFASKSTILVEYVCGDGPVGSGPAEIEFWIRKDEASWQLLPESGFGAYGAIEIYINSGEGQYELAAVPTDAAGNSADLPEHAGASFVLDSHHPTSQLVCEGYVTAPVAVLELSAEDNLSGVSWTRIWQRGSGEAWTPTEYITSSTQSSIEVFLEDGQGRYEFCSISMDRAGNLEPLPQDAECTLDYDVEYPTSSCSGPSYSKDSPIAVAFEASDAHTDIAKVTLWAGFGGSALSPVDTKQGQASGTFDFVPINGEGAYRFAVQAEDAAGNIERNPTTHDVSVVYDCTPPSVSCSAPSATSSSPITVHFNATDGCSGILEVKLYFKLGGDSWCHTGFTSTFGNGTAEFTPTDGDGEYDFCVMPRTAPAI